MKTERMIDSIKLIQKSDNPTKSRSKIKAETN